MDGSSGFKKEGNVEVPEICILPIGQQEVLKKKKKTVTKRQEEEEKSPKIRHLQSGYILSVSKDLMSIFCNLV